MRQFQKTILLVRKILTVLILVTVLAVSFSPLSYAAERQVGTVKWFSDEKGYGFITPQGGGDDLFVHTREVEGIIDLKEGQKVSFEPVQGLTGVQADKVRIED